MQVERRGGNGPVFTDAQPQLVLQPHQPLNQLVIEVVIFGEEWIIGALAVSGDFPLPHEPKDFLHESFSAINDEFTGADKDDLSNGEIPEAFQIPGVLGLETERLAL